MNVNDFVIFPGSKAGNSVRLKTKTVKELQLEKVQLETENREMENRLRQLQSNMSREKEERRKLGAYHWKSGQAGSRTIQARVQAQNNENRKQVYLEKVKFQILKDQIQEPMKEPAKLERGNFVGHENFELKGTACGLSEMKGRHVVPASEPTRSSLGKQDKRLLLSGAYDEEASAKSFQEALLQWRKGKSDPGKELRANEIPSESVGICEVQTNVTVVKEPIHVEFQDGLSYMEKILLKKYRRTPVDELFESFMRESRHVQALSAHRARAGGGGDRSGDDEDDDIQGLTDEEVKKYWASIYRVEEPNSVSKNAESSLKIEFLDDFCSKDSEESSDSLVEVTGAVGVNKQGKTDPLDSCGRYQKYRNPVSPKAIPQEKTIVCSDLYKNAVREENFEPKTVRRSRNSCDLSEAICNPTEAVSNKNLLETEPMSNKNLLEAEPVSNKNLLETEPMSNKNLLETQLQKSKREPQELGSACNSQSLVLPVMKKSSALQDVAKRQKSGSTSYQGLEGFFVVGANPKEGKLEAPPSLSAASSPMDRTVLFPGDGQWVSERSLSEYADDSVVQGVLESQLNRAANAFKAQNKICPLVVTWLPCPGPENHCTLTCDDVTSSSRREEVTSSSLEEICENTADFHSALELKDHDTFDISGDWDESQIDDEKAILEDKQQVLALQ